MLDGLSPASAQVRDVHRARRNGAGYSQRNVQAFHRPFPDRALLVQALKDPLYERRGAQVVRLVRLAKIIGAGDPEKVRKLEGYVGVNQHWFYGTRRLLRERLSPEGKLVAVSPLPNSLAIAWMAGSHVSSVDGGYAPSYAPPPPPVPTPGPGGGWGTASPSGSGSFTTADGRVSVNVLPRAVGADTAFVAEPVEA